MENRRKEDHIYLDKRVPLYQLILTIFSLVGAFWAVAYYQLTRDSGQDAMIALNTANIVKNSERDAQYQEYMKEALRDVKDNTKDQNNLLRDLIKHWKSK